VMGKKIEGWKGRQIWEVTGGKKKREERGQESGVGIYRVGSCT
jgi:hypothetical protein